MKFTINQIKKDRKTEKEAFDAVVLGKVDPLFFLTAYEEVCEIEADDLDEVFEIGNIGPEEKIRRFDFAPMHSISVGDVITDVYQQCWVVKGVGFERLGYSDCFGEEVAA